MFMEVAREHSRVLNEKKCGVKSNSVKFFGCVYDKHGAHPDPPKISVIKEMCAPQSKGKLPWNGNISLTIHPTTIFSHSNTQRTDVEYYWNNTYHLFDGSEYLVIIDYYSKM